MVYTKLKTALRVTGRLAPCLLLFSLPLIAARGQGENLLRNGRTFSASGTDGIYHEDEGEHALRTGSLAASSLNVELVGHVTLNDAKPGMISDVGVLGDFAYLGQFSPGCKSGDGGGVYIVDISDPTDPAEIGFIDTPGTYVGEGVQALSINTGSFRGDLLVVNGESCKTIPTRIGGFSLYDVSDPYHPVTLAENAGDSRTVAGVTRANMIHSAFAWQQGGEAFLVTVDDEEDTDVDIYDITKPTAPIMIAEVGLQSWPGAQDAQSIGIGSFRDSFFHDVIVKQVGGHWMMLLSYWDAGYILLNVDNPAAPVFVNDANFRELDPETGLKEPEGNGHQAEWSHDNRLILATSEDTSPYHIELTINTGVYAGGGFPSTQAPSNRPITQKDPLSGPTYFVGTACRNTPPPPAPSADSVALIERGDCMLTEKVASASDAGYAAALIFNSDEEWNCERLVNLAGVRKRPIPMLFVSRSTGYKILGIGGYVQENCPGGDNPSLPQAGAQGSDVTISAVFDGWGNVHLFAADTLVEIDNYALSEGMDPAFASGFGNLSAHEVAVDPRYDLAYLSYYNAGLRVILFDRSGIQEAGHYISQKGNNFWGVQVFSLPGDPARQTFVAASDRDDGLWIFKYTGPLHGLSRKPR